MIQAELLLRRRLLLQAQEETGPTFVPPQSAAHFMPLTKNTNDLIGRLQLRGQKITGKLNKVSGASFRTADDGIAYTLAEGERIYAVALDFNKDTTPTLSAQYNSYFFLVCPERDDKTGILGISLYGNRNKGNAGSSDLHGSRDFWYGSASKIWYTLGEWHRLCAAIIGSSMVLYIDGQLVGSHSGFSIDDSRGILFIGNNYRFLFTGYGHRTFGGDIRNVVAWNTAITEEDVRVNSILQY